ncbi:MAG TPA: ABC transporter permease subunit [Candidatus Limnocylindria bacterium]|nr:ABC transporter permease subunit [Candidatus Limnocylindria bacterium]
MRPLKRRETLARLLAALFWLGIWEAAARAVGQEFLLASPLAVVQSLARLLVSADTYLTALRSAARLLLGFLGGSLLGAGAAVLGARYAPLRHLFAPAVSAARSMPVASFAVLAIILAGSRSLSALVTLVVAFPVVYEATLEGLGQRDRQLAEMAAVFRVPGMRRALYVALPRVLPHLRAGLLAALGMCFKSGVAAELIGIPAGTVGEKLYIIKVSLRTPELFAWTVVIVGMSALCAAGLRALLQSLGKGLARL